MRDVQTARMLRMWRSSLLLVPPAITAGDIAEEALDLIASCYSLDVDCLRNRSSATLEAHALGTYDKRMSKGALWSAIARHFEAVDLRDAEIEWVKRPGNDPGSFGWLCDILNYDADRLAIKLLRRDFSVVPQ